MDNELNIKIIDHKLAKNFIENWHYSNRCPTGKNIFFGLYITDSHGEWLYAVADYGIGVNPYQAQSLSKLTGRDVKSTELLELKRLCRLEPKIDSIQLTWFISRCNRILKNKGYKYIVSFSDPTYGHTGGIYRAANFIYLGKTNAETHTVDSNGVIRHRRYYFRYAERNNVTVKQAREELGLELKKTLPKDRWFIKL
jgi:hypothetical protein